MYVHQMVYSKYAQTCEWILYNALKCKYRFWTRWDIFFFLQISPLNYIFNIYLYTTMEKFNANNEFCSTYLWIWNKYRERSQKLVSKFSQINSLRIALNISKFLSIIEHFHPTSIHFHRSTSHFHQFPPHFNPFPINFPSSSSSSYV